MSDQILLTVISFVSYLNSLDCQLVFDDISAIVNNLDLRSNETSVWSLLEHDYWGTPITSERSHKSYRPLTVFTFRLNWMLHQYDPFGYHLVNVILHTVVTLLYHHWCHFFTRNKNVALVAGVLFATHPIHTEAVSNCIIPPRTRYLKILLNLRDIVVSCYFIPHHITYLLQRLIFCC